MKIRTPVILTVMSFFFLLPLRWFNQLKFLGLDTEYAVGDTIFTIVISATLAVIVLCAMIAKGARIRVNTSKNIFMGIIMLLAAFAVLADGVLAYMSYESTKDFLILGSSSYDGLSLNMLSYMFTDKYGIDLPSWLLVDALILSGKKGLYYAIACAAGALGFLLMSFDFFGGRNFFRNKSLLALLPTVWGIARIFCLYMFYTTLADLSANFLDILFACSLIIFLFSQARLFADVNAHKSVKTAVASGLCCVVFSMCSNFIRATIIATGRGPLLSDLNNPNICDCVMTVMIIAYIFYIIAPRAHRPMEVEEISEGFNYNGEPSKHALSNQPHLFLNGESDFGADGNPLPPKAHTVIPSQVQDSDDDYYYGDYDSSGRRVVLPSKMNAKGTLTNKTYKLKKSPLSPNAHINKRLR